MTHIESKIVDADMTIFAFSRRALVTPSMIRSADYVFTIKDGEVESVKDRGLSDDDAPVVITAARLRELEESERELAHIQKQGLRIWIDSAKPDYSGEGE